MHKVHFTDEMTIQQVQALIMDALTDLNESMSRVDRSTTISDPQVQQVLTDLFGSDADGQREGDVDGILTREFVNACIQRWCDENLEEPITVSDVISVSDTVDFQSMTHDERVAHAFEVTSRRDIGGAVTLQQVYDAWIAVEELREGRPYLMTYIVTHMCGVALRVRAHTAVDAKEKFVKRFRMARLSELSVRLA